MRFGSLKSELIYNTIIEELNSIGDGDISAALFPNSLRLLSKEFSGLDERQYLSIIELIANAYFVGKQEKVSLVATVPPSFSLKTKRIQKCSRGNDSWRTKKRYVNRILHFWLYRQPDG